ncbi:hypothetical protein ACFLS9_09145 [Bacteroidota bacterium]
MKSKCEIQTGCPQGTLSQDQLEEYRKELDIFPKARLTQGTRIVTKGKAVFQVLPKVLSIEIDKENSQKPFMLESIPLMYIPPKEKIVKPKIKLFK